MLVWPLFVITKIGPQWQLPRQCLTEKLQTGEKPSGSRLYLQKHIDRLGINKLFGRKARKQLGLVSERNHQSMDQGVN